MAITRKPKKTTESKPARSKKAVDVAALINKGGSVVQSNTEKNEEKPVIQRVPEAILKRVDEAVAARRVKTSRNTWINEAILDLLEKEGF
jgi:hypothetical protein